MQPAWSMGTRNPKTRHANQLYLDEIPALRKALLSDPASRAAYDAELAVAQIAERERKLDELQRRVRLRAAKGGLSRVGSQTSRRRGGQARLERGRPAPGHPADPEPRRDRRARTATPSWMTTHPPTCSTRRLAGRSAWRSSIWAAVDLYDALGVTRDAPASYIAARADAERQRWMKKAQVTAEKTAWLEIITHAQSHLGSPKARARYDRTLALEAEESFEGLAEFALKGLSRLDPGTHAALIDEAAALGISSERADRLIGRICRRLGVTRESVAAPLRPHDRSRRFDSLPVGAGSGQRRTQVHAAALPALRGRDRDEPGDAQSQRRRGAGIAGRRSSGIARSASATPGSTSGDAPAGFAGAARTAGRDTSRRPSRRFATSTWTGRSSISSESRSLHRTSPARGMGSPRSGRGRRISPASSWPTRRRGPAAGWSPPGRPSKPGADWSTPNRPSSRPPGPS